MIIGLAPGQRDLFMHEPSVAIPPEEIGTDEIPSLTEDEVARLEKLLASRSRETGALSRELARRSSLLREALERMSMTAASELQVLREARDSAVARAIEAELGRAELAFQLDETRGVIHESNESNSSWPVGELRGLYSRVAQLEEADEAQRARLLLTEQDREAAQGRILLLDRQLVEESERFELSLLRARTEMSAQLAEQTKATTHAEVDASAQAASALRGERDGLLARLHESEAALRSLRERTSGAERLVSSLKDKLEETRAETAQLAVAAQARSHRLSELGLELAREQQELRAARAQLTAAVTAQQAERNARDSDAQAWLARLREAETTPTEAISVEQLSPDELRDFLATLRNPLAQLTAALDDPGATNKSAVAGAQAESTEHETTAPGTQHDPEVIASLEEKLRASEVRCAELEATLAARPRDASYTALKGELIDTRADAARLSDDLVKERTRRRRLVVTARALQAAFESGEAAGPWIEELIMLLNEGASVPPFTQS
ncbi:MAG TPA: hypothetical protein VHZ95_11730 [Polyangiales bacterium]|nr:hypothetical protein [Polyangiales bacterium]